jgi:hypothetical protein
LNKLASLDYDNIECWQIEEAFNKAQIEWVRRQLYGINSRKEGAEQSSGLIDDLQRLLKQEELTMVDKVQYYESTSIPSDYLHYVRTDVKAKADCCPERKMTVYHAEEANLSQLLMDRYREPNFEWGETISTILGNKVRVYTEDKFDITNAQLVYYRVPKPVQILGCVNPSTGVAYTADQVCEFNDDVAEIIVDEAAAVLAGDIESMNQYQRELQNSQRNS